MKTKLTGKEYIVVASMLFGLFFGAGNLIFPVSMGQMSGANMIPAAIGFCITGVGLPLLGIAAMGLSESTGLFNMSSKAGKVFAYFFTCALYLTIGPLFAIPRTATVSFQVGVAPEISDKFLPLALCIFSLIFFGLVLFFSLRPSEILTWVGKVLNPVFLVFLFVLIITSLIHPMGDISSVQPAGGYVSNSFFTGFIEGYNTMDALASLAFGIVLIEVIKKLGVTDSRHVSLCTIKSGVFSTLLMALIYCSLSALGAQSAKLLGVSADGGTALHLIAKHYFGSVGGLFLGIMITFACLKTSIGLVTACSTTFSEMFPKVLTYKRCAVIFSVFSFGISNIGLSSIIRFSLPVLMFLYPITIMLILLCLAGRLFRYRKCVFVSTLSVTTFFALADTLSTLAPFTFVRPVIDFLPFSDIGMSWILPALAGLVVGLIIHLTTSEKKTAANA